MKTAIEELKKSYIGEQPVMDEEVIRDLIRNGFRPFRVILSTPAGERMVMSIIAKSSADAAIRAIDMLYGEDEMISPRGLSITVKSLYLGN